MIATSNPIGRDETLVKDDDIKEIKDTLNELATEVKLIKQRLDVEGKSKDREATERLDLLRTHDRILRGYNGDKGLVSVVGDLKNWIDTRAGYEKLFIAGLIAQGLGVAFLVLKTLLGI